MINKRTLLVSIVSSLFLTLPSYSLTLDNMEFPQPPAYRVGISEIPENQYVQAEKDKYALENCINKAKEANATNENDMSYADLSLKNLSKEIAQDLEFDEQDMVADLSLLWQGAAMQSDTINFALYKLANPDADKPDKKSVKKVLQTLASMSAIAGAGLSNPLLAGSSLIGGNVFNIMTQDTKELNYKYTRVSDADMIILIRKVEDLQQNTVNLYYDYMTAKKQLDSINKLVEDRRDKFILAQKKNASKDLVVITDAYFRTAIDKQKVARSEFLSKRASLEQFVGNETFSMFEQELAQRLNSEKELNAENNINPEEDKLAYNQTIKNVEDYTSSLIQANTIQTNVVDDAEDENLAKLSDVEPLISADTASEKLAFLSEEEKAAKKQEKEIQRKEKERQKYSTKGLIFLHKDEPKEKKQSEQVTSESEVSLQEDNVKSDKKTKKDKKKKSKSKKSKQVQEQEKTLESSNQVPEVTQQPVTNLNNQRSKNVVNGVELLPLDDIKIPEIQHGHGYSIHSEYRY